ncbi:hypothetical protein Y032_0002g675 [Ancylostoma ceylanicum]|nr:hypothetical protein Y032_0002g675 [Ancylostoma ceylanicum]
MPLTMEVVVTVLLLLCYCFNAKSIRRRSEARYHNDIRSEGERIPAYGYNDAGYYPDEIHNRKNRHSLRSKMDRRHDHQDYEVINHHYTISEIGAFISALAKLNPDPDMVKSIPPEIGEENEEGEKGDSSKSIGTKHELDSILNDISRIKRSADRTEGGFEERSERSSVNTDDSDERTVEERSERFPQKRPVNSNPFMAFDESRYKEQAKSIADSVREDAWKNGHSEHGGDNKNHLSSTSMCTSFHKVFLKGKEKDGCAGAVAFADVVCTDYFLCALDEGRPPSECIPKICQKFKAMPKKYCFRNLFTYSILCENELGKYLKEQGKRDKREETGRMMVALGRAMLFSSHQLAAVRVPLLRFYQELHVFAERAIFDCSQTVEAVERARLEYRGSLLWMKKTSEELDPDTDRQLEKFREAQSAVRLNKEKLDKLKVDTRQKVDLLSASRSNLLSHLLGKYLEMLCAYYEKTCRAYTALSANLSTFQHYEFEILTDLIEPSKKVAKKVRQDSIEKEKRDNDYTQLPAADPEEEAVGNLLNFEDEPEGSLKRFLFGRESPVEEKNQEPEEERPESPLGVPANECGAEGVEKEQLNKIYIGPLPTLIDTEAEIPLLAPPPRAAPFQAQPSTSASKPFSLLTDTSGYSVQDLFPLVENKKQDPSQGTIVDLLGAPSSQFPNPFEEHKTTVSMNMRETKIFK